MAHIGKILFNLSIVLFLLAGTGMLSPIMYGIFIIVYYFALIIISIISLGTLFLNEGFKNLWDMNNFNGIFEIAFIIGTNLMYATVGISLLSAIFMLIDNKKSIPRIVIAFNIFTISLIVTIFSVIGG